MEEDQFEWNDLLEKFKQLIEERKENKTEPPLLIKVGQELYPTLKEGYKKTFENEYQALYQVKNDHDILIQLFDFMVNNTQHGITKHLNCPIHKQLCKDIIRHYKQDNACPDIIFDALKDEVEETTQRKQEAALTVVNNIHLLLAENNQEVISDIITAYVLLNLSKKNEHMANEIAAEIVTELGMKIIGMLKEFGEPVDTVSEEVNKYAYEE